MKTFFGIFAAFLLCVILLPLNLQAQAKTDFSIKVVNVRIYDYEKDRIVEKQTNPYGNGMEIFLSVMLDQASDDENLYTVTIEGFGKGRENEAEGLVEDYKTSVSKEITLYSQGSRYIAFVLDFPCVDETVYKVTVKQKSTGKKLEKSVKTKLGFCSMN